MTISDILQLFVVSVVTWRVSNMFINDYGFLHIFLRLRYKVGVKYEIYDDIIPEFYNTYKEFKPLIYENRDVYTKAVKTSHLSEIFTCIYCMSVWLSPLFILLFVGFNQQFIQNTLFVMGMVILIEEMSN